MKLRNILFWSAHSQLIFHLVERFSGFANRGNLFERGYAMFFKCYADISRLSIDNKERESWVLFDPYRLLQLWNTFKYIRWDVITKPIPQAQTRMRERQQFEGRIYEWISYGKIKNLKQLALKMMIWNVGSSTVGIHSLPLICGVSSKIKVLL